ncbi:sulfotransferase 2A1-like isoform X2 [Girardinichthys multiradiatus]|uniref:sulfotransferase 2A1-like isoform X2 n=1 Tax=Girardinichthys multiradiatus TaxID=208333 RepID=UPI001FAB71F9|nr:sulfotransferase 2A1-like isoform X2 [Girardinichthys multiradiatus]
MLTFLCETDPGRIYRVAPSYSKFRQSPSVFSWNLRRPYSFVPFTLLGTMTEADLYTLYKGVYVPNVIHSPESLNYCEEFTFRPDDVVIVTYPKSGTTWMQEILPLIISGGDPASVESLPNWDRVPWLEETRASILQLEERPSPRMLTTHLHYDMMPPSFFQAKPKVIYIMRNPKDVFTSSFHYCNMASFLVKPGPQSEFLQKFLDGKVIFGSWFDHVKGWLNAEEKQHIMYISYEELIKDLNESVNRITQFLGKALDPEVIEKIADRCLFINMKNNPVSNYSVVPREFMDQTKGQFLRKGVAGDWKNHLTPEEAEHFDAIFKEKMKDVKYKFAWD